MAIYVLMSRIGGLYKGFFFFTVGTFLHLTVVLSYHNIFHPPTNTPSLVLHV